MISIVASGSRGDVQPYIALGYGLKTAGYDVQILASENFETLATESSLNFQSTGTSIESIVQSDEWRKTLESGNFIKILGKMREESTRHAAEIARILPPLLAGSDLIITGMSGMIDVFSIAEKYKIPLLLAPVFPFTPTSEFPSPLVPELPFGKMLNKLSFHITRQMFWQNLKVSDTMLRNELGMDKAPFFGHFKAIREKNIPVLYGYSRHVLPRPADWDTNQYVTGYWFLDEPADWQPPPDLIAFLESGEPPVYIGFGSMGSRNPEEAGRIALDALKQTGQRGILASGWGGVNLADLSDTIYQIGSIPHSWLFQHMAAVVHHGGAGTTAAGLRAGIPSIIVPHMGDQSFWGHRVLKLGIGTTPIPRKKLTVENLAQAISTVVSDDAMRQRAKTLGEKIRAENGVQNAISLIEKLHLH